MRCVVALLSLLLRFTSRVGLQMYMSSVVIVCITCVCVLIVFRPEKTISGWKLCIERKNNYYFFQVNKKRRIMSPLLLGEPSPLPPYQVGYGEREYYIMGGGGGGDWEVY